jgi:ABC-type bacteriocin/lantibiotic exporter with double-glycine peptidase domain
VRGTELGELLVQFGKNELAMGVLAIFGILAGIEFLIKYTFHSVKLLKLLTKLGISSASRTQRRQLQKSLFVIRKVRTNDGIREMRNNAKGHREVAIIAVLTVLILYLFASFMKFKDPSLMVAGVLVILLRYLLSAILSYPALKIAQTYASDPAYWRHFYINALQGFKK